MVKNLGNTLSCPSKYASFVQLWSNQFKAFVKLDIQVHGHNYQCLLDLVCGLVIILLQQNKVDNHTLQMSI